MRWAEIDQSEKVWTIPAARTKNHREHIVPLTDAALALITSWPARKDREFIFGDGPRRIGDNERGYSGWSKSKNGLDQRIMAKPLPDWRLHDLRRTAATVMADRLGVLPHIIEAVLNHVSGHRAGVAGVYNRAKYEGDMREALQRWADHVQAITGG